MTLRKARPGRGELAKGLRGDATAYEVVFNPPCTAKPDTKNYSAFRCKLIAEG